MLVKKRTNQSLLLYPSTTKYLYGYGSQDLEIGAGPNGADYRYIQADDGDETDPADLGANEDVKYDISGTYFRTDPYRTHSETANGPIGVTQSSDGDGNDGTVHVSRIEFGTKFGSANLAEFVAFVSDQAATCTVYDTDGSALETETLITSNSAPAVVYGHPNTNDFGTSSATNYTSGAWHAECDKPAYAWYQINAGDETNLWSYPMMRQFTYPTPTVGSLAAEEQSPGPSAYWKFDAGHGTTAKDSVADYNGTLGTGSSAPSWQASDLCVSDECLYFEGTEDYVDVGTGPTSIKSVAFWTRPTTTTEYFIDLNGSAYISSSSGTVSATGFTSPTIYVDGMDSSTITADEWHYITVTTGTALSATDLDIGRIEGTGFMQGFLDEVKIYPYARSAAQVKADYIKGAGPHGGSAVLGKESDA
ncbi:LamG domain-containing protein [bacterium]|nr:LamG domain-containing protein [bacterium]